MRPRVEGHVFSFSVMRTLQSSEKGLKCCRALWALEEFRSRFQGVSNADLWTLEFVLDWE